MELLATYHERLLNALTSGIIAIDENDCIVAANHAAYRHLGASQNALAQGIAFHEIPCLAPFTGILEELKRTSAPVSRKEVHLGDQPWTQLEFGVSASPIEGPNGYNGAVFLFTDMTERRKLERNAAVNRQLASLGELAAGVVHELRNPLTIISGRAELLLRQLQGDTREYENARSILEEAKLLERAISQFLGFSKPFELKFAECRPSDVVGRAFQLCRARADKKSVRLDCDCPDSLERMYADAARLAEAIANIVSNAIDAVDECGKVTVRVSQSGGNTEFVIDDTGPGIHIDKDEDLFSPFFTKKRDGTGLGLSIVQRIVTAHNGRVGYANRPEGGARFTLMVPTMQGAPKP